MENIKFISSNTTKGQQKKKFTDLIEILKKKLLDNEYKLELIVDWSSKRDDDLAKCSIKKFEGYWHETVHFVFDTVSAAVTLTFKGEFNVGKAKELVKASAGSKYVITFNEETTFNAALLDKVVQLILEHYKFGFQAIFPKIFDFEALLVKDLP